MANHATQISGDPSAAAPAPVEMISPFFSTTMPQVTKSTRRGSTASLPTVNSPDEALSATVSWMRIFHSAMRESTTSKQAITHSVAATTSAGVTPGPRRSRLSRKAISPSARG